MNAEAIWKRRSGGARCGVRRGPGPVRLSGWMAIALLTGAAVGLPATATEVLARSRADQVRSGAYRYGEGRGATEEAAKEAARHDLVSRIRVMIVHEEKLAVSQYDMALTQQYHSSSRLLAVMQLEGLDYLELPRGPDRRFHYLAFVAEAALQAGMERQRQRIYSMIDEAAAAKRANPARLHEALRLTYWAYLLAHTVDSVAVGLAEVRLGDPRQALLQRLAHLVDRVDFQTEPAVIRGGRVIGVPLQVTYQGRPVTLDLAVYTGLGEGRDFLRVTNGRGYLELHGSPEAVIARRQSVQGWLQYIYEGELRRFPEIQALHEVLGREALNTRVTIPVVFPWVAEEDGPGAPPDSPAAPPSSCAALPLPAAIRTLAVQTEKPAFMEVFQAYVDNGRLQYYNQRPEAVPHGLYVAVVDPRRVLGVFCVDEAGYLEVGRQQRLGSLRQPAFDGAHAIWLVPVDTPQSGR